MPNLSAETAGAAELRGTGPVGERCSVDPLEHSLQHPPELDHQTCQQLGRPCHVSRCSTAGVGSGTHELHGSATTQLRRWQRCGPQRYSCHGAANKHSASDYTQRQAAASSASCAMELHLPAVVGTAHLQASSRQQRHEVPLRLLIAIAYCVGAASNYVLGSRWLSCVAPNEDSTNRTSAQRGFAGTTLPFAGTPSCRGVLGWPLLSC